MERNPQLGSDDLALLGDSSRHLPSEALEPRLAALTPTRDRGRLALIVSRDETGHRHTHASVELTPERGVPGDAWFRKTPDKPEAQITLMRIDVAELFANEQDLTLFGDNLLVDLDLSTENLPIGTRLRIGSALLEVTPKPHTGCLKFKRRFGDAALRLTAAPRFREQHLRGIYARTLEAGTVTVEDVIEIVGRQS